MTIMHDTISALAAERLFLSARTPLAFSSRPVGPELLRRLYHLVRLAPTAFNANPARILFVASAEAKERLMPAVGRGNREATAQAPVTAIVGYDRRFFEHLPVLFPDYDAARFFVDDAEAAEETAFRNGTLQGGYLILAARLLGLAAGPISGFDADKVDAAFFPDGRVRSNFLCNLGYPAETPLPPRHPRLSFEQACAVL